MAASMFRCFRPSNVFENALALRSTRNFHTSKDICGFSKAKSMRKIERKAAKMVQKKVTGKIEKKKWYVNPGLMDAKPKSELFMKRTLRLGLAKRLKQVSTVIHENVSHLIDSGALGQELVDHGLEVSKVEIPPDFNCINISWLGSGMPQRDDRLKEMLNSQAYKLRHELTQLRVIGIVPKINFIKDMSLARYNEIEHLLQTADMGPEDGGTIEHELHKSGGATDSKVNDIELPDLSDLNLRSDIFDVDHEALTKQVNVRKQKRTDRFFDADEILETAEKEHATELSTFLMHKKKMSSQSKRSERNTDEFASMEILSSLQKYGHTNSTNEYGYDNADRWEIEDDDDDMAPHEDYRK